MNISKIQLAFLFMAFTISIWSCRKDDDDDVVLNPGDNNNTPKEQVAPSEIINGSITTVVNPSGIAPLTAELRFNTPQLTTVEITVLGDIPVSNEFDPEINDHAVGVLGLYPSQLNRVAVKLSTASQFAYDTVDIQTDSLPSYFPSITIDTKNEALMEGGMNLNTVSISDGTNFQPYPMIYDNNGVIRWYLNLEGIYPGFRAPMELTDEGYLLFESQHGVKEYSLMGYQKKSLDLPAGYSNAHHDVYKMPNGNYLVAVDKDTARVLHNGQYVNSVEDIVIEMDGTSGALVTEWDLRYILDVDREDMVSANNGQLTYDWFHMNAVIYSEADDCIILSGKNQGLIKVDRNNQLKWIMAPKKGWGKAGITGQGAETTPHLLTAVNAAGVAYDSLVQYGYQAASDFGWNWGQHAPYIMENGNILLFDNGFLRNYQSGDYSRAVEYKVDESNMTVQQVWQYGKERGLETFSQIISDVDYLPNTGNVLFCPGIRFGQNYSKIVEVTYPGGTVVFEGTMNFANERSTGGGFGQFDLAYRAERVQLYH